MGARGWLLQLSSRNQRRGRVKLFLQGLPLSHVHEMPSQLPKSKQSTAISTMGWDWRGDTWTNLLLGCCRKPPESHAHLLNPVAPVSDPVASPCPLMRCRNAKFRPSSPRSLGYLVEGCTRGQDRGFFEVCLQRLLPVLYLSHPGTVLWYLAFIPLRLISSHLDLVKTIPCKQFIQQM